MFTLRKTCGQAPEVYEVRTGGELVAEIRTRWGQTTVTCYDGDSAGLEVYFDCEQIGINHLTDDERDRVLRHCLKAVQDWIDVGRPSEYTSRPVPNVDYVVEDQVQRTRLGTQT